ncbi:MAG TPA: hypothetical protein VFW33_12365, partial [Gemmataceae bacterium]|nr:hypothetical protein [Gemmataceae bacterium]
MRSLKPWRLIALLIGTSAFVARGPAAVARGEAPPGPPAPAVTRPQSLEQLAHMSWPELEALYRASGPCEAPVGFARGLAIYCPDAPLAGVRSRVTRW